MHIFAAIICSAFLGAQAGATCGESRISATVGQNITVNMTREDDLKEIEEDFIKPLNIPPTRVLMMPGLDKQENFHERTLFCLEMAKKYGYVGLTRMHISAWDETTGV